MRKGKYHMKVRRINDFCPAFIHPELFQNSLTVGAVSVAAGIIVDFDVTAILTLADGMSKRTALAFHDGMGSFLLDGRNGIPRVKSVPSVFEDLLDFISAHESPPILSNGLTAFPVPLEERWT